MEFRVFEEFQKIHRTFVFFYFYGILLNIQTTVWKMFFSNVLYFNYSTLFVIIFIFNKKKTLDVGWENYNDRIHKDKRDNRYFYYLFYLKWHQIVSDKGNHITSFSTFSFSINFKLRKERAVACYSTRS